MKELEFDPNHGVLLNDFYIFIGQVRISELINLVLKSIVLSLI